MRVRRLASSCARVDTRNHFMVLGWRPISYYCQLLLWRTAVKRNGDDDDDDGGERGCGTEDCLIWTHLACVLRISMPTAKVVKRTFRRG